MHLTSQEAVIAASALSLYVASGAVVPLHPDHVPRLPHRSPAVTATWRGDAALAARGRGGPVAGQAKPDREDRENSYTSKQDTSEREERGSEESKGERHPLLEASPNLDIFWGRRRATCEQ